MDIKPITVKELTEALAFALKHDVKQILLRRSSSSGIGLSCEVSVDDEEWTDITDYEAW